MKFSFQYIPPIFFAWIIGGFACALYTGYSNPYHWKSLCKNEFYVEWFPSISATIGDEVPERNMFRCAVAIASGFKVLMTIGYYYIFKKHSNEYMKSSMSRKSKFFLNWIFDVIVFVWVNILGFWVGMFRMATAGLWTYVASFENLKFHIASFVAYVIFSLFEKWILIGLLAVKYKTSTKQNAKEAKLMPSILCKLVLTISHQLLMIVAFIFYFKHRDKVYGGKVISNCLVILVLAYSWYSVCEWGMALLELLYDLSATIDFRGLELTIVDAHEQLAYKRK